MLSGMQTEAPLYAVAEGRTIDEALNANEHIEKVIKGSGCKISGVGNFVPTYNPDEANIYKVNVANNSYGKLFTGTYFYGVGVSPVTGDVFTSEVSFTSNSVLKVVASSDGTIINSATAGIGTCRYLFF